MIKRDNVYAKADETYVKTLLVYANESNVLFYDEALQNPVTTDVVEELFLKGVTVVSGGTYLKAVAFNTTGVICYDGTAAETFTATAPVEE